MILCNFSTQSLTSDFMTESFLVVHALTITAQISAVFVESLESSSRQNKSSSEDTAMSQPEKI